jgi:periodic tryptophan protein 1
MSQMARRRRLLCHFTPKKEFGSHIALGTMDPEIGIWTLDVLEGMYSDMVIGRPGKSTMHVPVPLGTGKKRKKEG